MKRSAPLRRTGFKRPPPPTPRGRQWTGHTPDLSPARATLRRDDGKARLTVQVPKFAYVRDTRIRDACRALPCQHCGAAGPDAGVTWAHSNQAAHGKAKGRKASDLYVAALCTACHSELDQGHADDRAGKVAMWTAAHQRTVSEALRLNLWPADIPPPLAAE